MKNSLLAAFIFTSILSLSFMPAKKIKVIFFGDSITQSGVEPHGYITIADSMLRSKGSTDYELVGAGISGNKVYDLYLRLEDDVISKSPDIVVIWIGVNDVWHKKMGTGTDADKFEKFYRAIIKKLKAVNAKIVVCTPASIGEINDNSNEQDGDLNKYSKIIRQIASDEELTLVDLRKDFMEFEKSDNTANLDRGILTADGVHLNDKGNAFVANLMVAGILKTR